MRTEFYSSAIITSVMVIISGVVFITLGQVFGCDFTSLSNTTTYSGVLQLLLGIVLLVGSIMGLCGSSFSSLSDNDSVSLISSVIVILVCNLVTGVRTIKEYGHYISNGFNDCDSLANTAIVVSSIQLVQSGVVVIILIIGGFWLSSCCRCASGSRHRV